MSPWTVTTAICESQRIPTFKQCCRLWRCVGNKIHAIVPAPERWRNFCVPSYPARSQRHSTAVATNMGIAIVADNCKKEQYSFGSAPWVYYTLSVKRRRRPGQEQHQRMLREKLYLSGASRHKSRSLSHIAKPFRQRKSHLVSSH